MSDLKRLLSGAYMIGYIDARNDKAIDPIGAIDRLTMNLNKNDFISRQDALNCINKLYEGHTACNMFEALDTVAEYIEELPSAERIGHWIKTEDGYYVCSLCKAEPNCCKGNYCMDCGARMVSEDDT